MDPLSHDDRLLVMRALRAALASDADTFSLSRSTVEVIKQIVHEGAIAVASLQLDRAMAGDHLADTRPAAKALVEAGWIPPNEAAALYDAAHIRVAANQENING